MQKRSPLPGENVLYQFKHTKSFIKTKFVSFGSKYNFDRFYLVAILS